MPELCPQTVEKPMLRLLLAAAAAAATAIVAAPAAASGPAQPTFNGLHLEAVAGTDGDFFYGGAVGYDRRLGRLVLGIENEIDLADARHCITLDFSINDRLCERRKRDIYLGGRIGFVVLHATLVYAKLGYTNLRLGEHYDGGTAGGSFHFTEKLDGVRLGAGIE